MKDLSLIEKFDAVLKALYDISGKRPTEIRIIILLSKRKKNVSQGEIWDIFRKMRREDLLNPEVTAPHSKHPTEILNLITFEGKLMYERGGLKSKLWRERFTRIWVSALSILTLIIAVLSFYYATKAVSDDTLKKVDERLQRGLLQQDSMRLLETNKLQILQRIDSNISSGNNSVKRIKIEK